jgi:hypothetical protein
MKCNRPPTYRGKMCSAGHRGLRYRSNRTCVTCTVERARAARQQVTLERRRARAEEIDIDLTC